MARPITERIATALKPDARITDVENLIADIEQEIAEASVERHRLEAVATSAKSTDAEAEAASDEAIKLGRMIVRREGQLKDLQSRLEELRGSERQKQLRAQYDAAQAENDQLTADLEEHWPKLSAGMVALIERIIQNDMAIAAVNAARPAGQPALISAEARARKCTENFMHLATGQPLGRFILSRIRGLDANPWHLWPAPKHLAPPLSLERSQYLLRSENR